jgi:putative spermidine/putrescine transport system substrate-binding protein
MVKDAKSGRILLILLAFILAGCGKSQAGREAVSPGGVKPVTITMFIWAGANQGVVPQEVGDQYMKDHPNVTIEYLESNNSVTYPKMLAAKKTTPDQPLVNFGFFNVTTIAKGEVDDMWISLDRTKIPNMNLVPEGYHRPGSRGIGYVDTPIGILYNTDHVKTPPTSWTDLWDNDFFSGKLAFCDYNWFAMSMASRLNGGSEVDMDPGFKIFAANAGKFHSLYNSNDQMKNLLVSGDAWITPWFSSISAVWQDEGAPLGWVVPKEGCIAYPCYLSIVQGSTPEQIAVCQEIINILLEPKWNGRYGELTKNRPCVQGAILPPELADAPYLTSALADHMIFFDWDGMAVHENEWKDRWDKEVKSKL